MAAISTAFYLNNVEICNPEDAQEETSFVFEEKAEPTEHEFPESFTDYTDIYVDSDGS